MAGVPVALVAAIVMRAAGGFGNLRVPRDSSWIEFLNLIKYPPSLVFALFMVGGNLLALAAIERARLWTTGLGRVLEVFGQAPLAFYIAHLWLFASIGIIGFRQGTSYGVVYAVWLAGLVPLFLSRGGTRASSAPSPGVVVAILLRADGGMSRGAELDCA